jgi:hypothetical protein
MTGIYLNGIEVTHTVSVSNATGVSVIGGNTVTGAIYGGAYEGISAAFSGLPSSMPWLNLSSSGALQTSGGASLLGELFVTVPSGSEAVRFQASGTNNYLTVKPETSANAAQLFYWNGGASAAGTLNLNGKIVIATASTTASASFNIVPGGVAPTSPANGDIWVVGGNIYVRLGSVTYNLNVANSVSTTKTTNYSQTATDSSLIFNGAGSITLTLVAASSVPGQWLYVKTIAAQTVVSASSNVVPLTGGAAGTAILSASAGKWAALQSDSTNWIIMAAN